MSSVPGPSDRADLRFAAASVAAVEKHDPVFELETGKPGLHRLLTVGVQIEPSVGDVGRPDGLRSHRQPGPAAIDGRAWDSPR